MPIISIALNGEILDANQAAMDLTGRPIEETRGHSFAEYIEPDDAERALALFMDVVAGERKDTTFRVLHKDGRALPVKASGVPIVVEGQVVGVHGFVRPENDEGP